jgi:hypothetical protein
MSVCCFPSSCLRCSALLGLPVAFPGFLPFIGLQEIFQEPQVFSDFGEMASGPVRYFAYWSFFLSILSKVAVDSSPF